MFRYLTAGESHGPALVGILDGLPAQLALNVGEINAALRKRQGGYGRGARMQIEADEIEFLAGVRGSKTLGSPIAVVIHNRDFENNRALMDPLTGSGRPLTAPRPGHADYAGALKYRHSDLRNVLERASARETAMRVALGAICAQFLSAMGIETLSYVSSVADVEASDQLQPQRAAIDASSVRCPDPAATQAMEAAIDRARAAGDTLGGAYVVQIDGVPAGIGSNRQPDTRLDGILAGALMGMQTVKAVEVGAGRAISSRSGSKAHDTFAMRDSVVTRGSNRAGGIEGGISNGEPIVLRASVKPLATLQRPLQSVDLHHGTEAAATVVRSDVCVVPAASIVGEAMARLALTGPILEKYGGDSMEEVITNLKHSTRAAGELFRKRLHPQPRAGA
ncbi:MAG: chorismate synthase [Candidatus Eremiobacteraeota bacterium]|nr:chorismate synthase [Candidatus Eremiobacteraeota bacterium]MBV9972082.1 chorismate synthase [Candidatus Eremiobacteraeota bacterium]